jgi:hypothetical protein
MLVSHIRARKFELYVPLVSSYAAVIGYFALRFVMRIPGYEQQTDASLFLTHIMTSISYTMSLKGLYLNALPVFLLCLLAGLPLFANRGRNSNICDISSLFILVLLATMADTAYNIGRIAMYTYPLYLPSLSDFVDEVLEMVGDRKY